MVLSLGTLFEAALLVVNAIAILNEERFLKKGILVKYFLVPELGFRKRLSLVTTHTVPLTRKYQALSVTIFYCVCVFTRAFQSCAVGWGRDYRNEGFGEQNGIKHQLVAVITAVQTLLRGESLLADPTDGIAITRPVMFLAWKIKPKIKLASMPFVKSIVSTLVSKECLSAYSSYVNRVERMFISLYMRTD